MSPESTLPPLDLDRLNRLHAGVLRFGLDVVKIAAGCRDFHNPTTPQTSQPGHDGDPKPRDSTVTIDLTMLASEQTPSTRDKSQLP